jgi:cytochrome P450
MTSMHSLPAFLGLIARKTRETAGDDLLSALVAVRDVGKRLAEDELLGMAWLHGVGLLRF